MSEIIVLDYVVVESMGLEYLRLEYLKLASVLRSSDIELSSPINKTMNVSSEIELE